MNSTTRLRSLLAQPQILVAPGAADALTARLIEQAGFAAAYATGAGIANAQFALPDIGLVSFTEQFEHVRRIANAITIPLIADADTGYGNPLNVMRTVREFERVDVAAIQLEDQVSPKRCGHFENKEVIAAEEMVQKIRAALEARRDADLVIIARTDALAKHGVEEAIARARLYSASGADVVFVEAPTDREIVARLPREINAPLLFNLTAGAMTPFFSNRELHAYGYKIVIYPNTGLRVAIRAAQNAFAILRDEGTSRGLIEQMVDWDERQRIVSLHEYDSLERKFKTETPQLAVHLIREEKRQ